MTELKAYKVCNLTRQTFYGVAVNSLGQLKIRGGDALGFSPDASVSVVLEDDGTIVEDEDYFLCLPADTKLMLLNYRETWTPALQVDGRTGQPNRESVDLEVDGQDNVDGAESWHSAANCLKQNLGNIILMSEADLQSLIDVPCSDLATALGFSQQKSRILQETLQTIVDRREEERQSKELLQLYLKAIEQESNQNPPETSAKLDETDGVQVETTAAFSSRILSVLKHKTHPETRLSNEELQMVVRQGVDVMVEALGWDRERTAVLVQDCGAELSKRLQRVQALHSLSAQNQSLNTTLQPQTKRETRAKRRKQQP
ncbi:DNA fragmentation factor subunit alpha [Triplophysa rosa]|uniref:DNAation factor subunit alpha n=1 Tax=Triplophysa rosa TaxID=992332 RepID=A0A9W7WAZ4_TRIRA|nr:DNA fragmentation factor subunit alpha [Triplophysa rosa]KAI7794237.1 DNA fragmentation factor subunit alpha [Triplophysa rosa]